MTTVAYRDGVIAADTLLTADGTRCGEAPKVYREGRLIIGFCGKLANFEAFRTWVRAGMSGGFKSEGGNVLIVPPDGPAVIWGDGETPWREVAAMWALGSGEQFALGAMAAGADAEAAVRAAITYDTGSGGEVTVLRRGGI